MIKQLKKEFKTWNKTGMGRSERVSYVRGIRKMEQGAKATRAKVMAAKGALNERANKVLMKNMVNKYNASKSGVSSATKALPKLGKYGKIGLAAGGALAVGGYVANKFRKRKRVIGKSKIVK